MNCVGLSIREMTLIYHFDDGYIIDFNRLPRLSAYNT